MTRLPHEFKEFPKIPRLNRDVVITEKLDGTNACIYIAEALGEVIEFGAHGTISAQSRNKVIAPGDDNYGFAAWVQKYQIPLTHTLGPGYHYGEWWGSGIQRGYGLKNGDKRFSLFNAHRWGQVDLSSVPGLGVVPVLYSGEFDSIVIDTIVSEMTEIGGGSRAVPGYMDPEGIIIWHTAAQQMFKVTCKNDDKPKGSKE